MHDDGEVFAKHHEEQARHGGASQEFHERACSYIRSLREERLMPEVDNPSWAHGKWAAEYDSYNDCYIIQTEYGRFVARVRPTVVAHWMVRANNAALEARAPKGNVEVARLRQEVAEERAKGDGLDRLTRYMSDIESWKALNAAAESRASKAEAALRAAREWIEEHPPDCQCESGEVESATCPHYSYGDLRARIRAALDEASGTARGARPQQPTPSPKASP